MNMKKINNIPEIIRAWKLAIGCELCGYDASPYALQFDHIDPSTKYRTKSGKLVHISDMAKGNRYGLQTVMNEVQKCRVLCANCHAHYTHETQRVAN
jgi:hypothetical protein